MKVIHLHKNRFVWLLLILLISLGLVGVALAAAGQTARSVVGMQGVTPQTKGVVQPAQSLPPSPIQNSNYQQEIQSQPDPALEQMRTSAMQESRSSRIGSEPDVRGYLTDADVGQSATSLAPAGVNGAHIPQGIVVDTYLDYIYGKVTAADVIVNRPDGAYGAGETDDTGFFWTSMFNNGVQVPIEPGNVLDFDIDGPGPSMTVGPEPFGFIDVVSNTITGHIDGRFVWSAQYRLRYLRRFNGWIR
jgi:hypothetical protein